MGKRIKLKESSLTRLIKRIVMEQTYSTTTEPSLGATDSYIHTQTKQADDAKDSEDHVVIDNQPDVEHYLEEEEHEMPEEWMDELEDETGIQRPMSYPQDLPDVEYSNSPAPTTIPTKTPTITPTRPKRQDPFKVPHIKPGEEPAPKAGSEEDDVFDYKQRLNPNDAGHLEKMTMSESQLVEMIENLIVEATEGKGCANTSKGCVRKRDGGWIILNNKKGGVWKKCKSKSHCKDMLEAMHANS
jgi:hypothetical protein